MLEVKVDNGSMKIRAEGDTSQLLTNIVLIIREVHNGISERSKDDAKFFKYALEKAVNDGLPYMDSEDLQKAVQAKVKEVFADPDDPDDLELTDEEAIELIKLLGKVLK